MRWRKTSLVLALIILFNASCKQQNYTHYEGANVQLDSAYNGSNLDVIIGPYRSAVDSTMNKVIGFATEALVNRSPESSLSNFAVDVIFERGIAYAQRNSELNDLSVNNTIGLINFGGLRAPISAGDITVGNVYELMPFDNAIVVVKLSPLAVQELIEYIPVEGGQPVANCIMDYSEEIPVLQINNKSYDDGELYVITSNYLASGGDGMKFLEESEMKWDTGILMRDVFIEHISAVDTLMVPKVTGRIILKE
ncbi:MAG: 5'-nucleotidase C-terminal domain-containing protein [Crocinitomicaceae bacterium]